MDEVPPLDGQDPPRPHGAAAQQEERAEPASAEISEVFKYFLMSCKSATRRTYNSGAVLDRDVVEHFRAGPRRRAPAQRGAALRLTEAYVTRCRALHASKAHTMVDPSPPAATAPASGATTTGSPPANAARRGPQNIPRRRRSSATA